MSNKIITEDTIKSCVAAMIASLNKQVNEGGAHGCSILGLPDDGNVTLSGHVSLAALARDGMRAILPVFGEAFAKIAEETDVEEWPCDNGGRETGSPEEHANKIAAAIRAAAKGARE